MMEYEQLLERAYETLPKKKDSSERFEMPTPDAMVHGTKTIIRNFDDICTKIRRSPDEVAKFLFKELAIPGLRETGKLILHGKLNTRLINDKLALYIQTHVICKECKKPDTHLEHHGRGPKIMICEACGARSTVFE